IQDHILILKSMERELPNIVAALCYLDLYFHFLICCVLAQKFTDLFECNVALESLPRNILADMEPPVELYKGPREDRAPFILTPLIQMRAGELHQSFANEF
ncbi:MAG: hypothetical protein ACRD98_11650, partial [Nitrososphaera sp.]